MKTVIEMAREAAGDDWALFREFMPEIHKLAELVRAEEREACAALADKLEWSDNKGVASAIRVRGNT